MVRILGVGLLAALALSPGASADQEQLTKEAYLAAVEHAIDTVPHQDWMSADSSLRDEIERFVDRLKRMEPPAEVTEIHAAWISSLEDCAQRYRKPGQDVTPCLDRHRAICDRFYAQGYSFG